MSIESAPRDVQEWYKKRCERFKGQMSKRDWIITYDGMRSAQSGWREADWRIFHELMTMFDLDNRSDEDIRELDRRERHILRQRPPRVVNGIEYDAPWHIGVRLQAARELWSGSTSLEQDTLTRESDVEEADLPF